MIQFASEILGDSPYVWISFNILVFVFALWLKKKTKIPALNPMLVSTIIIISTVLFLQVDYKDYEAGTSFITAFITPATVCLAVPLYRQIDYLKDNLAAILLGILSGVLTCAVSIFALSKLFRLSHLYYVSLLPKSITTAIAINISEELGGILPLTIIAVLLSGLTGSILGSFVCKIAKIEEPLSVGISMGTSAHALGTARALEIGEVEGAMSGLAIVVAGIMTVIVIPFVENLI